MIVVDTSALLAIAQDEPTTAAACAAAIEAEDRVLISAGTVAEALIVAGRRGARDEVQSLIESLGFEVAPVTAAAAQRMAQAYDRWGKGVNPAGLNFGDCFAYELAKTTDCPLLFVGDDFNRTDVKAAI
ncbi:MAG: type II toxin-antitoxin system VapC family toxin [Proteobacteria bacterium]|nr:type II toxin-antitoxin system VapC family toxin [Pseudomonadota bacterium]